MRLSYLNVWNFANGKRYKDWVFDGLVVFEARRKRPRGRERSQPSLMHLRRGAPLLTYARATARLPLADAGDTGRDQSGRLTSGPPFAVQSENADGSCALAGASREL